MASSINASTSGGGGIITTADATGNLNIQSGGSTVVAVTAAGATVTGTLAATGAVTLTGSLNTPNTFGFKNRIINGGMVIDQRNAGASVTPTQGQYTLDRWQSLLLQASKFTVQQNAGAVTAPAGFINYLGVTSSSAYSVLSTDYFAQATYIEGLNATDLGWGTANAQSVTLSFWVRSSLTGTFGGSIQNYANNYSYPFTYAISSANTWTYATVTISGPTAGTWLTTNSGLLQLSFSLGVGSTYQGTAGTWASSGRVLSPPGCVSVVGTSGATFYITGVQLEKGSTATSFDFRAYSTELAMCQRYYQNSFAVGNVPGTSVAVKDSVTVTAWNDGSAPFQGMFPVPMRASPTVTLRPRSSVTSGQVNSNGTNRAGVASEISEKGVSYIAVTTGTVNAYCSYTYECSSEL